MLQGSNLSHQGPLIYRYRLDQLGNLFRLTVAKTDFVYLESSLSLFFLSETLAEPTSEMFDLVYGCNSSSTSPRVAFD